jgi:hypothetical protein
MAPTPSPATLKPTNTPEAKIGMHIFLTEDVGGPQKFIGPFSSGCVSICAPFFVVIICDFCKKLLPTFIVIQSIAN